MYINMPTPFLIFFFSISEGYDSNQEAAAYQPEQIPQHFEFPSQTYYEGSERSPRPPQYDHYQPPLARPPQSPASDEGFVEEQHSHNNLPNFEKIQVRCCTFFYPAVMHFKLFMIFKSFSYIQDIESVNYYFLEYFA